MKRPDMDNSIFDIGCEVTEFYKMANMADIIIKAIFNGENVTLQSVGNSVDVFLGQMKAVIARIDNLYMERDNRFSWIHGDYGSPDTYYEQEYEKFSSGKLEGRHEKKIPGHIVAYFLFLEQLPKEQWEMLCNMLKDKRADSHKQGFIDGYKAAVGRCYEEGGCVSGE